MTEPQFGRLITAMITPFNAELELDLERTEEFADRLVKGGTDSIIVCGTTGESPTVFYPQKIDVIKAVIKAVDGRVPVIANVGDNCTADTVEFAADVAKLGVDGFMCVVPYYNKPPQEGLYQHFKTIAQSTELPIILYNIPSRCVINMKAETTLRLANDCENVVAIKEASGEGHRRRRARRVRRLFGRRFVHASPHGSGRRWRDFHHFERRTRPHEGDRDGGCARRLGQGTRAQRETPSAHGRVV